MTGSSFRYLFKEGFRNTWSNRMMSIASICVLMSCLVLIGCASMIFLNIESLLGRIEEENVVMVYIQDDTSDADIAAMDTQLKGLDNVKEVEFVTDVQDFTSYTLKPQLKTVGPKYGKQLGRIKTALSELDGNSAMSTLNEQGFLSFQFDGQNVELTKDDLLIEMTQKQGFISETDNTVIVVLDTRLTPELIEEGFVREIISKVQTMRKEAGFEVTDHITVYVRNNEFISSVLKANETFIKNEVLAEQISYDQMDGYEKEWTINGKRVVLGVKRW